MLLLSSVFVKEDFNCFRVFLKCSVFDKLLKFNLESSQKGKYPRRFKNFTRSLSLGRLPFQDGYNYLRNSSLNSPYTTYLGHSSFYWRIERLAFKGKILFSWEVTHSFKKDFSEDSVKVSFLMEQFGVFRTSPTYNYWYISKARCAVTFMIDLTMRYMFYNHRKVLCGKKKELAVRLGLKHKVQKNEIYLSTILKKNTYLYFRSSKLTLRSSQNTLLEVSSIPTYPNY